MVFENEFINEIYPSIYRIKIRLPKSPLKFINSYLVKGKKSLLIDTAMNIESCYEELSYALNKLEIDRNQLDLFITHIHADHIGLADRFLNTSKVYLSDIEYQVVINAIKDPKYWNVMNEFMLINGMPKNVLDEALNYLDRVYMHTYPSMNDQLIDNFKFIKDGEELIYGDYVFKGILTPGHSPGHMCLYENNEKILFSGDHVLFDITPNITWWPNMDNSLKSYIESLSMIENYSINNVFPGHGNPGKNINQRIEEIKKHHNERLKEIVTTMNTEPKTAYEIASQISWNIKYEAWDLFPKTQQYFALGETIAHLIYLEKEGKIKSIKKDNKIYYLK